MSRVRLVQNSMIGGELDPLMGSRSDIGAYANGCEDLENVWPLATGGVQRRPGTFYVDTVADDVRLASFVFNDTQKYVIVFYNTAFKVYTTAGVLATTVTSCPWTTAQLGELTWTQSADTMIVCHPDFHPQRILRTGATTFTVGDLPFEADASGYPVHQPFFAYQSPEITLTPSATTGSITLTTSADHWTSDHVGAFVRYEGKQTEITGFTSATQVTATVRETLSATSASTNWDESAFSDAQGYPRCVAFHEQRLWFAGNTENPGGLYGSKAAGFFNFDVGTAEDDEAILFTIAGDQINEIRHLVSSRHLQVFADQAEFFCPQGSTSTLTPSNMAARRQTPYGTPQKVRPKPMDGATLFVQDNNKTVREFLFADTEQAYNSTPVSLLSDHLIGSPVDMDICYGTDQRPEQLAFFVNTDGSLAWFHTSRNDKIAQWGPWTTDGDFKRVCVVKDEIFFAVSRTINSVTETHIEKLGTSASDTALDFSVTVTAGSPTTAFSTLTHLSSDTAFINSGNYHLGSFPVDGSGNVTLDVSVTTITAGLNYTPQIKPMPIDFQDQGGGVMGEMKRVSAITLNLVDTLNITANGKDLIIRQTTDDLSQEPTPVTDKKRFFLLGYDRDGQVAISQSVPLPFTLLGFQLEVRT